MKKICFRFPYRFLCAIIINCLLLPVSTSQDSHSTVSFHSTDKELKIFYKQKFNNPSNDLETLNMDVNSLMLTTKKLKKILKIYSILAQHVATLRDYNTIARFSYLQQLYTFQLFHESKLQFEISTERHFKEHLSKTQELNHSITSQIKTFEENLQKESEISLLEKIELNNNIFRGKLDQISVDIMNIVAKHKFRQEYKDVVPEKEKAKIIAGSSPTTIFGNIVDSFSIFNLFIFIITERENFYIKKFDYFLKTTDESLKLLKEDLNSLLESASERIKVFNEAYSILKPKEFEEVPNLISDITQKFLTFLDLKKQISKQKLETKLIEFNKKFDFLENRDLYKENMQKVIKKLKELKFEDEEGVETVKLELFKFFTYNSRLALKLINPVLGGLKKIIEKANFFFEWAVYITEGEEDLFPRINGKKWKPIIYTQVFNNIIANYGNLCKELKLLEMEKKKVQEFIEEVIVGSMAIESFEEIRSKTVLAAKTIEGELLIGVLENFKKIIEDMIVLEDIKIEEKTIWLEQIKKQKWNMEDINTFYIESQKLLDKEINTNNR